MLNCKYKADQNSQLTLVLNYSCYQHSIKTSIKKKNQWGTKTHGFDILLFPRATHLSFGSLNRLPSSSLGPFQSIIHLQPKEIFLKDKSDHSPLPSKIVQPPWPWSGPCLLLFSKASLALRLHWTACSSLSPHFLFHISVFCPHSSPSWKVLSCLVHLANIRHLLKPSFEVTFPWVVSWSPWYLIPEVLILECPYLSPSGGTDAYSTSCSQYPTRFWLKIDK